MTYEQELTFELRMRGRSESEIAESLREMRAHGGDATSFAEEFGAPAEYARGFERRKRTSLGARVTVVATVTAIVWVAVWIAAGLIRKHALDIDPPLAGIIESWGVSWGAVAIAFAGVLIGFLVDRFRPVSVNDRADPAGHTGR